jgi:hypothetical protein
MRNYLLFPSHHAGHEQATVDFQTVAAKAPVRIIYERTHIY